MARSRRSGSRSGRLFGRTHRHRHLRRPGSRIETLEHRLLLATVSVEPVIDNTLFESSSGNLSNGAGDFLYAGRTLQNLNRRALLAFDLAAAGIPVGSDVTDVTLTLSVSKAAQNTNSTAPFTLHRVDQDWGEAGSNAGNPGGRGAPAQAGDATWLHAFSNSDTWDTPGGDFQSTVSAMLSVGGAGTAAVWSSSGMVSDVQNWVDTPNSNFGWIILGDEAMVGSARRFNSRENLNQPPRLEVTYTEPVAETLILNFADAQISERDGVTTATVTRTGSSGPLTVNLLSSDTTEATVADSVVIPAGATVSPAFAISAVDDAVLDGTQSVTITASAMGAVSGQETLEVTDFEELTLVLAASVISEAGGTTTAIVRRTDTAGDLAVNLQSSDETAATVVSTVTIPDGQAESAPFTVSAVDDRLLDGDQAVVVSAAAAGYEEGSDSLEVADDERQVATAPIKDNTLFESETGDLSGGLSPSLFVGRNGNGVIRRSLLAFDLAAAGIPAGASIQEARLELLVSRTNTGDSNATLHRVSQDWGEGNSGSVGAGGGSGAPAEAGDATWLHTFFNTDLWATAGGDFAGVASATSVVGGVGTTAVWSSSELVADLQSWLHVPATNFGWMVVGDESQVSTSKRFDSKDTVDGTAPQLFVTYSPPSEQLALVIDSSSVSESGGNAQATLSRSGDLVGDLTVFLSSNDASEASVPATVTIPAGAASVSFSIAAVDDDLLDGAQVVTVSAAATGFSPAGQSIEVADFEQLVLTVQDSSISENGGVTTATLTRPDSAGPLTVDLSSDDTSEATVPATVTFADGSASVEFAVTAVDDDDDDGTQGVMIAATAGGYVAGSAAISVTDDDGAPTTVRIENGVLILTAGDSDDALTFSTNGADLTISDPANLIAVASNPMAPANQVTLPLASFPSGLRVETGDGSDAVIFAASVSGSLLAGLQFVGGVGDDIVIVEGQGAGLDLAQFTNVDILDIRGNGNNSLQLTIDSVLQNHESSGDRLFILENLGDSFTLDAGWQMTGSELNSTFFRVLQQGDATLLLAGPANWQNPVNRLDVSNDGSISPVADVLPLINEINNPRITDGGAFPAPTSELFPAPFMDVSGDDTLSPVGDILPIINFLNNQISPQGEGEGGDGAAAGNQPSIAWLSDASASSTVVSSAANVDADSPLTSAGERFRFSAAFPVDDPQGGAADPASELEQEGDDELLSSLEAFFASWE